MFKKLISKLLIVALILAPATSYCLPNGGQVVAGSATIKNTDAATMSINQTTNKAIINWNSFSIAGKEAVNVIQPSTAAILLNRVTGIDPSSILGSLSANGQVWVVNPNGVFFGPSARVDVNGLVASTLDIANPDFLAGKYNFKTAANAKGIVSNQANINLSRPGAYIAFLSAQDINTSGLLQVDLGTVILATGNALTLNLDSKGTISVAVTQATANTLTKTDATSQAVLLTSKDLKTVLTQAVNTQGITEAKALTANKDGTVALVATPGNINISGPI